MIFESLDEFCGFIDTHPHFDIALTSMPGDPLHPGHISCLQAINEAVRKAYDRLGMPHNPFNTVCIVNGDQFLINKKGFRFMPLADRLAIIDNIRDGVDYVVGFDASDKRDQTVCEAIRRIKPKFFLKGGDRKADETLPEWNVCKEVGCTIIDRVGADKVWSSSNYLNEYKKFILENASK